MQANVRNRERPLRCRDLKSTQSLRRSQRKRPDVDAQCSDEFPVKQREAECNKGYLLEIGRFTALIINGNTPLNPIPIDTSIRLDAVIVTHWCQRTEMILTLLLDRMSTGLLRSGQPDLFIGCLIIPCLVKLMSSSQPNQVNSSKLPSSVEKSSKISVVEPNDVVATAMRLRVTVLQLLRRRTSRSGFLSLRVKSNFHLIHDICLYPVNDSQSKSKGLTLYQQIGCGRLELIPLFNSQGNGIFAPLFVWHNSPINRLVSSTTHTKLFVMDKVANQLCTRSVSQNSSQLRSIKLAHFIDSSQLIADKSCHQLPSFLHDLLNRDWLARRSQSTSMTRSFKSDENRSFKFGQHGLVQSKTFSTGLDRLQQSSRNIYGTSPSVNRPMQRRRLPNSVTVDSALFRKGSSKLSSRKAKDETNTVEKTDATDDARAQSQPRPVTSKSNNDIANSKPVNKDQENCNSPLPSPTSTNVDVSSNLEGDLYADHHPHCDQTDSDTISHIPKSFSYDSVVDSTDQSIHPTWCPMIGWPDIFPDNSVVCATVLLAIPEIGESDYFAESPQQLTIDELKQLGIYGDDGDESETEEEEDSVGDVSCGSSPTNRDLSSSNKSQTGDFQWQSTMTEKTVNEVEPISVE